MALKLIANYSKRLGLPGYSSHQFSVCVETEIASIDDVAGESARLYETLQASVDSEIQHTGFVPGEGYGQPNREHNGSSRPARNGVNNGTTNGSSNGGNGWACSDKQRDFIERIVRENGIDKHEVEDLSNEMFGHGVKSLNRLAASGLIDELLDRYGKRQGSGNGRSRPPARNGSGVRS